MFIRQLNDADREELRAELASFPYTFRVRKFRNSTRIVFTSSVDRAHVAAVLNELGFRFITGSQFTEHSFNGPSEIFIHARIKGN